MRSQVCPMQKLRPFTVGRDRESHERASSSGQQTPPPPGGPCVPNSGAPPGRSPACGPGASSLPICFPSHPSILGSEAGSTRSRAPLAPAPHRLARFS